MLAFMASRSSERAQFVCAAPENEHTPTRTEIPPIAPFCLLTDETKSALCFLALASLVEPLKADESVIDPETSNTSVMATSDFVSAFCDVGAGAELDTGACGACVD